MKAVTGDELMVRGVDVAGLLRVRSRRPEYLSLYLSVPLDPAELGGLPRVSEFLAEAAGDGQLPDASRMAVRQAVEAHARDWRGRSIAIFTSAESGLQEEVPLARTIPGYEIPERAVLACRPHALPLLAALQWYPAFRVAVVDKRHAWVFSIAGAGTQDSIEALGAADVARAANAGFGGWCGLDTYGVQQRITELARHHHRDTAALLAELTRERGAQPLVLGGCGEGVRDLFDSLPTAARESFAGSFAADPHELTPSRVRDLAAPFVARSADEGARHFAAEVCRRQPSGLAAAGLPACLAAVNDLAVAQLAAPVDRLLPGYACGSCGQLGRTATCAGCEGAATAVPDLIDEMACRVLEDGGRVLAMHGDPASLTARLRFPVASR